MAQLEALLALNRARVAQGVPRIDRGLTGARAHPLAAQAFVVTLRARRGRCRAAHTSRRHTRRAPFRCRRAAHAHAQGQVSGTSTVGQSTAHAEW